jgi:hypothetical protein
MERRGCSLGCVVFALGLVLSCCLLPYLVSSVYSIVSSVLGVPTAATWLWGDWRNTLVGSDSALYMILAEGPICCVGTVALLIVILGLVIIISGFGSREVADYGEEEYEPSLNEKLESLD